MSKRSLTKVQRRKQKLSERRDRQVRRTSSIATPYRGNKYRSDELVPIHFATEQAIYTAWRVMHREFRDACVTEELHSLIENLRTRSLTDVFADESKTLIHCLILNRWKELDAEGQLPSRDNLIGVLRSILASIEAHPSGDGCGYLRFLGGFLKKLGFTVHAVEELPADDPQSVPALEVAPESIAPETADMFWRHARTSTASEVT